MLERRVLQLWRRRQKRFDTRRGQLHERAEDHDPEAQSALFVFRHPPVANQERRLIRAMPVDSARLSRSRDAVSPCFPNFTAFDRAGDCGSAADLRHKKFCEVS